MLISRCFICNEVITDVHCTTITRKNLGVFSFKTIDLHNKCFEASSGPEFTEKLQSLHLEKRDLCGHPMFKSDDKDNYKCVECGMILYDFYIKYLDSTGIKIKKE